MARRKASKSAPAAAPNGGKVSAEEGQIAAAKPKRATKAVRRSATKKAARRGRPPLSAQAKAKRGRPTKAAAASARGRSKGGRTRYTDEKRQEILATAQREGLTAATVQKRFGVTPVTYYSWRKKSGTAKRRGRPPGSRNLNDRGVAATGSIDEMIRREVREKIAAMLPEILQSEISGALDASLSRRGR